MEKITYLALNARKKVKENNFFFAHLLKFSFLVLSIDTLVLKNCVIQ